MKGILVSGSNNRTWLIYDSMFVICFGISVVEQETFLVLWLLSVLLAFAVLL